MSVARLHRMAADQIAAGVGLLLGAQAHRDHRDQRRVRQRVLLDAGSSAARPAHIARTTSLTVTPAAPLDVLDAVQRP